MKSFVPLDRPAAMLAFAWLTGCASVGAPVGPQRVPAPAATGAAWVEWGAAPIARTVVAAGAACPTLSIDGVPCAMALRAPAATPAVRPNAAGVSKAAAFPVEVCDAPLPAGAGSVRLGDRALPPPRRGARRIVVLGDTGCRLKAQVSQACADPGSWPFAQVAAAAAALAPDLVIHVGDYHYRETPCPAADRGCAASPWGYGWDAWDADFFTPAAPLLAAAPWVFVRGNHEECARAGQGWFRLLAPEPFTARRSCDRPEDDAVADTSPPYAVPLGAGTQLVVFDSARAGNAPLDPARPGDAATLAAYVAGARALDDLAAPGVRTWFASHHPVLAFTPDDRPGATRPLPGNPALQRALDEVNGAVYFPPATQLALHGHVHLFQALGFGDGHPATLVAGNGGDRLDEALPAPLPPDAQPAPGTRLAHWTTSDAFGFVVLERAGAAGDGCWTASVRRPDGSEMTRCELGPDGTLRCAPQGVVR